MLIAIDKRGAINLPPVILERLGLERGQYLELTVGADGRIVLEPAILSPAASPSGKRENPFPRTSLESVIGCLRYDGPARTLEDM